MLGNSPGAIWSPTYHHPDLFISWNLLTDRVIWGIKVVKKAIPIQEEIKTWINSAGSPSCSLTPESVCSSSSNAKLNASKYKRIQKRKNHQSSDLDALPEKLK